MSLFFGFALLSELARKERVRGMLVPSEGVIHITAQGPGRVDEIEIHQGQKVFAGSNLFTIVNDQQGAFLGSLESELIGEIDSKLNLLKEAIVELDLLIQIEVSSNQARREELLQQLAAFNNEQLLLDARIHSQSEKLITLNELDKTGPVSQLEIMEVEDVLLSMQQLSEQLGQKKLSIRHQLRDNKTQREQLPIRYGERIRNIKVRQSDLTMQKRELQTSFRTVIKAPTDATVSVLQTSPNQQLTSGDPLASLIAEGSSLVANLFLPPGSAGLISVGDKVMLRFDAFPYQKYGQLEAEVVEIDQSLMRPDRHANVSLEAGYLIRASLTAQSIDKDGDHYPLKAGLLFEADVLLEERRLIDLVLKPLMGLRARIG